MPDLMTTPEVAEMLRTAEATLRFWRYEGTGPRSAKLGRRVVYRRSDVEQWLEEQFSADRSA
ncbi:helix-turn-helix domain-containing protein [Georgenia sp. MJ173]|uniref:helix-turn-helix transcriptional regulator n=1 Tax=Georgenia sunbinii TaxID=3117728 RepID=UPI002F26186D